MYAMNAKLARRLLKLNLSVDAPRLNFVQNAMWNTNNLIYTKWLNITEQARPCFDLSRLEYLDFS
jgi:hypothetical protein